MSNSWFPVSPHTLINYKFTKRENQQNHSMIQSLIFARLRDVCVFIFYFSVSPLFFSLRTDSSYISLISICVQTEHERSQSHSFGTRNDAQARERKIRVHDIFSANSKSLLLRSRSCELFERWTDDAQMYAKWSHRISWMNKSSS